MLSEGFKNWTERCITLVEKNGVHETASFADEVVWVMEDGAERCLDAHEIKEAKKIVSEIKEMKEST